MILKNNSNRYSGVRRGRWSGRGSWCGRETRLNWSYGWLLGAVVVGVVVVGVVVVGVVVVGMVVVENGGLLVCLNFDKNRLILVFY